MKGIAYVVRASNGLHAGGNAEADGAGPGVPDARVLGDFPERVRPFVRVRRVACREVRGLRDGPAARPPLWLSSYEGFGLVLLEG